MKNKSKRGELMTELASRDLERLQGYMDVLENPMTKKEQLIFKLGYSIGGQAAMEAMEMLRWGADE